MSRFTERYHKEKRFYLYYQYKNMKARVNGKKDGGGVARWLGLPILNRNEFIDWALNDPGFHEAWDEWIINGGRGPTVHRINRYDGYILGNMMYVSHAEKSRKHLEDGQRTRARKKNSV